MKYVSIACMIIAVIIYAGDIKDRMFGVAQFNVFEAAIFFLVLSCAISLIWPSENATKQTDRTPGRAP